VYVADMDGVLEGVVVGVELIVIDAEREDEELAVRVVLAVEEGVGAEEGVLEGVCVLVSVLVTEGVVVLLGV
jgi:hypothetical protein